MGAWKKVPNAQCPCPLKRLTDTRNFPHYCAYRVKNPPYGLMMHAVDNDALDPHYKADIWETSPSLGMVVQQRVFCSSTEKSCFSSFWLASVTVSSGMRFVATLYHLMDLACSLFSVHIKLDVTYPWFLCYNDAPLECHCPPKIAFHWVFSCNFTYKRTWWYVMGGTCRFVRKL